MRSMLLGDTSNLDASVQTLYQEGGIAHIIAISGSHLTIVGELILAVLRKWQKPVFAKLETALGAMVLCLAYGRLGCRLAGGDHDEFKNL